MKCSPFGDRAVLVDLEIDDHPDRGARTRSLRAALRATLGGLDVVVGAGSVLVAGIGREGVSAIEAVVRSAPEPKGDDAGARAHEVPVVYDGADLEEVARIVGASAGEVAAMHAGRDHVVELLGFLPGFAYLGPVDRRLTRVPRRGSPRPRVDAGSVALAGGFTGIYPLSSPGGWHLIGRTTFATFDADRDPPAAFRPGDRVRFVACTPAELPPAAPPPVVRRAAAAALVVEHASPGCSIQDAGRSGRLGDGLPASGPLDPDTHAAANVAVGNDGGDAAIEVPLGRLRLGALRDVLISIDGDTPIAVRAGSTVEVVPGARAARYLAVRGGVDVPVVLGARATLVVARLGGFWGRYLLAGDRLAVGERETGPPRIPARPTTTQPIEIAAGPHLDRFAPGALERFVASAWTASPRSDRVGIRLDGPAVARDAPDLALPVPMVRGAIQVTTDGTPIVLGPDHPVTGGYPVIAVVRPSSFGALARSRSGSTLRFRLPDEHGLAGA